MDLIDDAYDCQACPREQFQFTPRPSGDGYYKFPPTIGARGPASLLFVGINPRRSRSNLRLHRELAEHRESFRILAENRVPYSGRAGGPRYISTRGEEKHYRLHAEIVERAFGRGAAFEDHAAVTELFLCATEDSRTLPRAGSPCADRYFAKVVCRVRPEIILAVGSMPRNYLMGHTIGQQDGAFRVEIAGHQAWLLMVVHPRAGYPQAEIARLAHQIKRVQAHKTRTVDRLTTSRRTQSNQCATRSPRNDAAASTQLMSPSKANASVPPPTEIGPLWGEILRRNGTDSRQTHVLAPILAAHPDAVDLSAELLRNLTAWQFIRIANVEHNKLRPQQIPTGSDPVARSRAAWELFFHQLATTRMTTKADVAAGRKETDWVRLEARLERGAEPALNYLGSLPITAVITACENLIAGPYRAV